MRNANITGSGKFKSNEYELKSNFKIEINLRGLDRRRKAKIRTELINKDYGLYNLPYFPWILEGSDKQGKPVLVKGMTLVSSRLGFHEEHNSSELGFNFDELIIGSETEFNRVDFLIPNLVIGFDNALKHKRKWTLAITNLDVNYNNDTYNIKLRGYKNLFDKKDSLDNGTAQITVKLSVKKNKKYITFNEARIIADMILDLITFVYADRVSWFCAKGYNNANSEAYTFYRNIVPPKAKPFRQLIRLGNPRVLSKFIGLSFPLYSNLKEQQRKNINTLIEGMHFSADRLHFPSPFVNLGAAIEQYAQNTLADRDNHYISRAKRREILSSFETWINGYVIPLLKQDDLIDFDDNGIKQKLSDVVQRNLRSRITNLMEYYGLQYDVDWIKNFVKQRNNAAHGTYIYDKDHYLIWTRMMSLLEVGILRSLNYTEEYWDWAVSPPESKMMN